eukprot:9560601-Lingulodinium_polyedra.AAC.1
MPRRARIGGQTVSSGTHWPTSRPRRPRRGCATAPRQRASTTASTSGTHAPTATSCRSSRTTTTTWPS